MKGWGRGEHTRQREQHVQRPQEKPPQGLKELNEGQRSSSKTRSGLPTSSDPRGVEAAK